MTQDLPEPTCWMLASALDDFKCGRYVEVSRNKEEPDDVALYTATTVRRLIEEAEQGMK